MDEGPGNSPADGTGNADTAGAGKLPLTPALLAILQPRVPAGFVELHRPLHQALREKILSAADRCAADRAALDDYAAAFPGGRPGAALLAKPAFVERVRTFAGSFSELTELVDRAVLIGCPWRDLIADARIEAGLDSGFDAERQFILARAAKAFLEEEEAA